MTERKHSLTKAETQFIKTVWDFYDTHGRHDLPWRGTTDPYRIVVSELMLQQTQVARVIPKYREFLKQFPSVRQLAGAPLGDVLKAWQGLGYNRRAKFLWQAAQAVRSGYNGRWPKTFEGLTSLPGIGSYTAAAVMAFAYNRSYPLIETNIRTVYIHHFFTDDAKVADSELLPIIERITDKSRAREWNWALMDYGAYLKTTVGNLNAKSSTYKKQSSFKESNRYVRGAILRALSSATMTNVQLEHSLVTIEAAKIAEQLTALQVEGLVAKRAGKYQLP